MAGAKTVIRQSGTVNLVIRVLEPSLPVGRAVPHAPRKGHSGDIEKIQRNGVKYR